MKRLVILISGRGSNMQAILDTAMPARVAAVVSNKAAAAGLAIARSRRIETRLVEHGSYPSRDAFDRALADVVALFEPDLVVLAGFMRILSPNFVERFESRLINIHPSLLPAFPGLNTHRRALEAGVRVHGATVHFVSARLDHGPIIIQAAVPVLQDDDESTLAARVLRQEHRIVPQAVRWFIEGRLQLTPEGAVRLQGATAADAALISPQADQCEKV